MPAEAVPQLKLPEPSVVPIGVKSNELPGIEPDTATCELGEAPEIETVHVSPGCTVVPPREVENESRPPAVGVTPVLFSTGGGTL